MKFSLLHTDTASKARAGELTTDHGKIETPIFMPVGTAATVKGVHQRDLAALAVSTPAIKDLIAPMLVHAPTSTPNLPLGYTRLHQPSTCTLSNILTMKPM